MRTQRADFWSSVPLHYKNRCQIYAFINAFWKMQHINVSSISEVLPKGTIFVSVGSWASVH